MKRYAINPLCALVVGAMTLAAPVAFAGTIYKAGSGTDLAAGAGWTNGVAPGAGDVATWVTGSLGGALTMSTAPTWGGIAMTAATADPVIAAPGSGAFTLGSSGVDLSSSANNMTINAPITLDANQTWNVNAGKTLTVGGIISGAAFGITKNGAGTLTLSVSNSFGGGVTINAGTNVIGSAFALGTNSVTLNGGVLKNNGGYNISNNIVVGSSGGMITLNAAANASYFGNLSGAGNLTLGSSWGGGASTVFMIGTNLMTGGTITMSPTPAVARLKSADASSAVLDWVINGGSTEVAGNFNFGSFSGSGNFNAFNNNSGQTTTYYLGGNNHDATYSAVVSANGTGQQLSVVKIGTGAQTFSGNNSYTGTTTVEDGSLIASNNVNASGASPFGNAATAIFVGDDLAINTNVAMHPQLLIGGAFTMARPLTVGTSGGSLGDPGTTFTLGGNSANSATFSGAFIALNQNLVVTQAAGGSLTISAPISEDGNTRSLIKVGGGSVTLSGANSYAGPTVVDQGVLLIGNTSPDNGVVTVADGAEAGVAATLDSTYWSPSSLTVGASTGGTLQFSLGGTITGPNANTLLTPASLTLNGTTTINITRCPQVLGLYPLFDGYNGSSPLTLASQPAGVLGEITASGGTVYFQVTNTITDVWTAQVSTNWDAGTANWTNNIHANTYSFGDPVWFDDTANGASPLLVNIVSNVSPNSITVSNFSKAYVIGGQAIAGATGLIKIGNSTLALTGTNAFTGDLTILGGTLEIGEGDGGQLGAGTYGGNIDDETLLRYNSPNSQTLSGIISGNGALVVSKGTLTLSGANSYSSGTTLSNGTLVVNNSTAVGSGTVTLAGGTFRSGAGVTVNNIVSALTNTTTIWDVQGGNFTFNGQLTGGGTITRGTGATLSLFLGGDNSQFYGTYQDQVSGNAVTRINSASSGSANARWVFNQGTSGRLSLNFGNGAISFGSMTGGGFVQQATTGTTELQAGALGLNDTFSGVMQQANAGTVLVFTKVGMGRMTLSGANTFLGGVNISNGILSVSNNSALSTAGNITFGGGTLQYSAVNGADYSPRIANSAAAISIDLNGTNVTFAAALPSSNTGGLSLTNSTGVSTNKLTLAAAEAYTGSTIINGGTLALFGNGTINFSTNITIASGGTFDVSGVSYTLGGSQTLAGSGIVTGAVTTASSGSAILPGGTGTVGTLTFEGNLNLGGGSAPVFDISTSHLTGNDQIVVTGNLTLGAGDAIHVNALNGSTALDETSDYVLFGVAGTTTMTTQPVLVFDNTPPSDASHYSIQTSGNNVVLHYSSTAAPVLTSVIITNTADGSTVGMRGQSATIYVTVQPGNGALGAGSVKADLSSLGGSSTQALNYLGANNWSYTFVIGQSATVGTDSVGVTATDSLSASGSFAGSFTVNASALTWNGLGGDANWGTEGNWVGTVPPGFGGDSVTFTGSGNTSPNLEANYNVAGVTFDGAASSFTNHSTTDKALTLNGPVNNSSGNPQIFNLAVVMNGSPIIADSGAGITFAGPISGAGLEVSAGTVTLAGANTYTANTLIDAGATLKVSSSAALPFGSGVGNVSTSGTLDINGTNAAVNGLSGSGIVDNTSTNPAVLSIGNADTGSTFAGVIQNTGTDLALVKTGTNTLTLNGANTYSGGTTVSNGTLQFANDSAFGTGVITANGGTIQNTATGVNITTTNNLVVNGAVTLDTVTKNWTINGNISGSGTITRGIPAIALSLTLGGDNSGFTGTYQDQNNGNAVTRFSANTAGSATARWIFNQPTLGRTSLPATSGTIRFGSFSGIGTLSDGGSGIVNTVEVGALGLNDTFSGVIGQFTGTIGLTKVGSGTLALTGANTYTGPTVVSNGTLVVSSLKISSGDFTLVDGTTLGITLTTNSASLSMTSLTLGNNCTNSFTGLNSTTVPAVANSGLLTLSGQVVVNAQGNFAIGQYPLISYASIAGTGGFVIGSLPAGVAANVITNGNAVVLNVSQAPVSGPVTITNSFGGNTLTLTWPAGQGWRLVSQTNLNANANAWVTVPGYNDGSYSVTVDTSIPTVFYRLVNP